MPTAACLSGTCPKNTAPSTVENSGPAAPAAATGPARPTR